MKYMIHISQFMGEENYNVITTSDEVSFISFPAAVGNPNYDKFLVDANLTDKKARALTPDKWYEFPKETA